MALVRAVSVFAAQSQARSQRVLDSAKVVTLSLILFVIFTDRISRCSRGEESVRFGDLRVASLLFAEGAEPEGDALYLQVHLRSNPHLWSQALGSDRKNEITDTSGQNEFPPQGGWAQP